MENNVKDHQAKLERVVWRDECTHRQAVCSKHSDERHAEVIKRLDKLESAFTTCMQDLISAMQSHNDLN